MPSFAQNGVLPGPPPSHYTLDERGVDLIQGSFNTSLTDVVIGQPGEGGIAYTRTFAGHGWRDNMTGRLEVIASGQYVVSIGGASDVFNQSGSTYTAAAGNGSTLVATSSAEYTYTTADGTKAVFTNPASEPPVPVGGTNPAGRIKTLTHPDGRSLAFTYAAAVIIPSPEVRAYRLSNVVSNSGYGLTFQYARGLATSEGQIPEWLTITKVTGWNATVEYCPFACPINPPNPDRPTATYAGESVTNQSGETTLVSGGYNLTGIRYPGSTADDVSVTYDAANRVASVTTAGQTWEYDYTTSGSTRTTVITDPLNNEWTAVSNLATNRLTSWVDPLGNTTSYLYDAQGRNTRVTLPEGQQTRLTYNARGGVTETRLVAKAGSALADIVTSATYPSSCANPVTCNSPTTTTDPRGGVTDYAYDPVHGGVLAVTAPAASAGQARPQTRWSYEPLYAWYLTGSGTTPAQAPTPVYRLTEVSTCSTGASCDGTAAETVQTFGYGPAGVANNRLPVSVTQGSGDGALTAATALTYTQVGDVRTVDGPLPGGDDLTLYRYDASRRQTGRVGPDPDGAGTLRHRAVRTSYNPRGQVTLSEVGTVAGYTDANWTAFSSLQQVATTYDSHSRPVQQRVQADGATFSLAQVSYDALGRTDCVVQRMNPATFASPPASACSAAATGPFGRDRITRHGYDDAGRLTSTTSGFGVDPITESAAYTNNGKPLTLTDGKGNVSTMVYDGFDRMSRLRYPNASGGGSSTTDYEEYGYDAASNVTSYRNRGGDSFALTYDALNRLTLSNAPTGTNDTSYTYDLLGRTLSTAAGGQTLTFTWDALGRRLSEGGPQGIVSSQYDLAGRRTRLTWPNSPAFYVDYDYDLTGALTRVRENGATTGQGVLATYTYDNLGRRTVLQRGNTVRTDYGYDGAGRLTSLVQNLAGTADDLTLGFAYNPAGQVATRTVSNTAYAYTPGTGSTAYVNNGRNQLTSVGGAAVGYDARQNITSQLGASYGYNALNQVTSANPGTPAALTYDPAGRLQQTAGSTTTRYQYDGVQLIAEYNSAGALLRRHVPGLGLDDVIATVEGADRRWLVGDERGSVVALTNSSAALANRNTYDEYGQPGPTNAGRFQYTGQVWLPEARVYHYRARAYAPDLGRFLQADPIGYAAGPNLYAYVGADPVNLADPLGLEEGPTDLGEIPVNWSCPPNAICRPEDIERFIQNILDSHVNGPIAHLGEIIVTGKRGSDECPTGSALGDAGTILDNTLGGAEAGAQAILANGHNALPDGAGHLFSWPGRIVTGVSAIVNVVESSQAGNSLGSAVLEEATVQGIDAGIGVTGTALGGLAGFALCGPACAAGGGYLGGAGASWVADHFGVSRTVARWVVGRGEASGC